MVTNTAIDDLDFNSDEDAYGEVSPTFRQLPRNIEAERGLLGAIFVDNRALENVAEFLFAEHFALTAHARIYEAMMKLIDRGQIADPTTLRPYFEADDSLERYRRRQVPGAIGRQRHQRHQRPRIRPHHL